MQAIILAAGMGRRLGDFTAHNTKCMVEVNGVRLIDRMLYQLKELNLSRIVIVIGYEGANLRSHIEANYPGWKIDFVVNDIYDHTNNIYSLWLAKKYLEADDTLLLESDLIFEDRALAMALESQCPNVALVSKYETWMDGTMVMIDGDRNIVNFIPKKAFDYNDTDYYYKTVNIYKFSRDFVVNHYLPFLEAYIKVLGENEYYEQVLRVITLIDRSEMKALPITGIHWYEIDDVQDLRIAEAIFASPKERLRKIQNSYGGYWRYPSLTDFCYLVNPYFPTSKMIDEMKANFETLLREYPSGMSVNSLLAGKYFGVRQDSIVVGNGAAELIKSLMGMTTGKVGVTYPTFEEYPNRLHGDMIVKFRPSNPDFRYTAGELTAYFADKDIKTLLLVNPDNPSGNFLPKGELLFLIDWCEQRGIMPVIDESFVDFGAEGGADSLIREEILSSHPSLCVVKSVSKSYGVPGLRLGVIASGNHVLIERLKKDVAIWNINSFAEFYLQIYGKYENDYRAACEKFREERRRFARELTRIDFLRVIPSQANYFLCEVTGRFSSYELTLLLLSRFNILIKDCSGKKGFDTELQYVRIAIRDKKDNDRLVEALTLL